VIGHAPPHHTVYPRVLHIILLNHTVFPQVHALIAPDHTVFPRVWALIEDGRAELAAGVNEDEEPGGTFRQRCCLKWLPDGRFRTIRRVL